MSNQDLEHLFTPGTGTVPPYLAGREQEQEYFQKCIRALKNRKPISQDMIVYGPRGNGKTALFSYLEKETLQKEGTKVDIQWVTPGKMETPAEFENTLTGKKTLKDRFKKLIASVGISSTSASFEYDLSSSLTTAEDQIKKRCKKKPLILIIDEAHTLKPEVGKALLNASQTVRREGHPFLLVLAGTPNLKATLAKADASFWERGERIPLGRLSPEEARQAITVPLENVGVSFAPDAAEKIVANTHCYPYFTQVWGSCLARRLHQTGARIISMDTIKEVEAVAKIKCEAMYQDRFDEIKRMGLLAVAESVSHAFIQCGEQYLHERTLEEAIERGMTIDDPITNESIMVKFEQLSHLGYVWKTIHPEGWYGYEPGIPSLMSFVQRNTLDQTIGEAASTAEPGDASRNPGKEKTVAERVQEIQDQEKKPKAPEERKRAAAERVKQWRKERDQGQERGGGFGIGD